MRKATGLIAVLALLALPAPAFAAGADERLDRVEERLDRLEKTSGVSPGAEVLRPVGTSGLELESADGRHSIEFGGCIMNDWVFWGSPDRDLDAAVGPFEDGTEFRRARLFVSGRLYSAISYKAQYDFAGGDPAFKDVWMALNDVPVVGTIRVGHFKEPMSLEELTSSKYITFMERSLPVEAFAPSRNTGIAFGDGLFEGRGSWALGVFRDSGDFGESSSESGEYNLTGRLTWVPWLDEENDRTAHVGASYSLRSPSDDTLRLRSRPEVHQSPRLVDTGSFSADGLKVAGLEGAVVLGPVSFQSEYLMADADADPSDVDFSGWYVTASYFLTGENRPYDTGAGDFGRVKAKSRFMDPDGTGAWEVAARYSSLDLCDGAVDGGELDDLTVGLNWYLNPHARIMWNYVHTDADGLGDVDAFGMRFQVDF